MSHPPDRPLTLGEVFAETIHLYGARLWSSFGLGTVVAGAFLVATAAPPLVDVLVLSLAFTAAYGVAARLAAGDRFGEAWAQVGVRLPVLAVLALVVAVPFAITVGYLLLLLFAVAWIALAGFSIPVAMLERDPEARGVFGRLAYSLFRSVQLARAEYLHAVGVAAALVLVYLLVGRLVAEALVGFAENSAVAAVALVQVVMAPFFFLGLAVLYFEQRARLAQRPARP